MVGSICYHCYAKKGNYRYPSVELSQSRKLASISDELWCDAMVSLIEPHQFFRWHDSGDVQGAEHLDKIVEVCQRTPKTKHWMPTRERRLIEGYIKKFGPLPTNLVVRMSAPFFDVTVKPIDGIATTSGSHKLKPAIGFECPAPSQGGECSTCRACWDKRVHHVSYKAH